MTQKHERDINEILLEAHQKGVEQAIDLSISTGTSLVIEENEVISEIKPKYGYISEFQSVNTKLNNLLNEPTFLISHLYHDTLNT